MSRTVEEQLEPIYAELIKRLGKADDAGQGRRLMASAKEMATGQDESKLNRHSKPGVRLSSTSVHRRREPSSSGSRRSFEGRTMNEAAEGSRVTPQRPSKSAVRRSFEDDYGVHLEHAGSSEAHQDLPEQLKHLVREYQGMLNEKDHLIGALKNDLVVLQERLIKMEGQLAPVGRSDKQTGAVKEQGNEDSSDGHLVHARQKISMDEEEWRLLKEQAALVLQENETLEQHVKRLAAQMHEDNMTSKRKLAKAEERLATCEAERRLLEDEVASSAARFSDLREEHCVLLLRIQDRMPREEHSRAIQECKLYLDELRSNYDRDSSSAHSKLKTLKEDNSRLSLNLSDQIAQSDNLLAENRVLLAAHRKLLLRIKRLRVEGTKRKAERQLLKVRLRLLDEEVIHATKRGNECAKMALDFYDETKALMHRVEEQDLAQDKMEQFRMSRTQLMNKLKNEIQRLQMEDAASDARRRSKQSSGAKRG